MFNIFKCFLWTYSEDHIGFLFNLVRITLIGFPVLNEIFIGYI